MRYFQFLTIIIKNIVTRVRMLTIIKKYTYNIIKKMKPQIILRIKNFSDYCSTFSQFIYWLCIFKIFEHEYNTRPSPFINAIDIINR